MSRITIRKPEGPIRARIVLPRSKSVANRALVLASLAGQSDVVIDLPTSDDTRILDALIRERALAMHCGLGGTTFRFLTAWAAVQPGEDRLITGDKKLLERPHHTLVQALIALGARIDGLASGLLVHGTEMKGGELTVDSPVSSQFISALLLIAPKMSDGLRLRWTGRRLSEPYVHMTIEVLRHFGARVEVSEELIHVFPGPLHAKPITVPMDWSAAAFWFEVVALAKDARITLEGLHSGTWQGDERAIELWAPWVKAERTADGLELSSLSPQGHPTKPPQGHPKGTLRMSSIDLTDTPDLFQPLALSLFGRGEKATITGLHNLALKESDRLRAVQEAVNALGGTSSITDAQFELKGRMDRLPSEPFDPKGDHRMAMALAPLALVHGSITIQDPDVVHKSYPGFWEDMKRAGFGITG